MPRIPKAASSAEMARTSGTMAATRAPNVISRMMKVSPIVMNVRSRPLLISSVMSWFVRVWLTECTVNPAVLASIAAIAGRIGTTCRVTTAVSPSTRATIRTVDWSGDTRNASGGAVRGSWIWSTAGTV